MKILSLVLTSILLASCSSVKNNSLIVDTTKTVPNKVAVTAVEKSEKKIDQVSSCSIIASRNWKISLKKSKENNGQNILIVHGEVDLPSSDYTVSWQRGLLDRMLPPGFRLAITTQRNDRQIKVVADGKPVISVPLKYSVQTPVKNFRYISIYCDDMHLIKIGGVQINRMSD